MYKAISSASVANKLAVCQAIRFLSSVYRQKQLSHKTLCRFFCDTDLLCFAFKRIHCLGNRRHVLASKKFAQPHERCVVVDEVSVDSPSRLLR